MVAKLSEFGFESERFDRINDFTKQIAIVPLISPTKEGIPELLMVITGLAQKFLESSLQYNPDAPAKGTILEVKEEKGLGTTVDAIIYDGTLKVNDLLVIAGLDKPVVTKIRALLEPEELAEMRAKKSKFKPVKQVYAATGVKISAPDLDKVLSGMPLAIATEKTLAQVSAELQKEVTEIAAETGTAGVVIKADNLGSLEALTSLLKEKGIESEIINMEGNNVFSKMFSSVSLADWTSYYLALEYGQDPTPVDMVESLKKILAS